MNWLKQILSRRRRFDEIGESIQSTSKKRSTN